jgi:hypothetical protein
MPELAEGAGAGTVLSGWQQGDVILADSPYFTHLADLRLPLTEESRELATSEADATTDFLQGVLYQPIGVVIVTQTCDIVRDQNRRPFVELCPLVQVNALALEEIRRLKQPRFAYVPGVAHRNLVADLDRTMTIEKSVLINCKRVEGCTSDTDTRSFAEALSRKKSRFAFPNDFVEAVKNMSERLKKLHGKRDGTGTFAQSLREIKVRAASSWSAQRVSLTFFFILDDEAPPPSENSHEQVTEWMGLFDTSGRFGFDPDVPWRTCYLGDLDAATYLARLIHEAMRRDALWAPGAALQHVS